MTAIHPRIPPLAAAGVALLFTMGCSGDNGREEGAHPAAVPVIVGKVQQRDVPVQLKAVGTVEAYSTVTVRPQVDGVLSGVHFREGDEVGEGELLFSIDPRPFQAMVAQAEAILARDRAQVRHAEVEARRYEDLVNKDFVTREEYEEIRTNSEALGAALQADQAALDNARLQLSYCSIRSPVAGRTGGLQVHEGNVVRAKETELLTIHRIRPIRVRFAVPEQNLEEIQRCLKAGTIGVEARTSGGEDHPAGRLTFIDNMVDRGTGTIQLKATFGNDEGRLWPGEFLNVVLTLATLPDAIVVPTRTVQAGQQGDYVFVVRADSTAELRPVRVGTAADEETVIREGLRAGETVVTDGQLNLVPGARVAIKTPERKG